MVRIEELDRLDDDDDVPTTRRRDNITQNNDDEGTIDNNEDAEGPSFDEQVAAQREAMQPTPMEKFMAILKSLIMRAMVVYFIMTFIRNSASTPKTDVTTTGAKPPPSLASSNAFNNGTIFDMYVYISEENMESMDGKRLIWKQEGMTYGDWYAGDNHDGTFSTSVTFPISERVQRNGSLYIHTYLVPFGKSLQQNSTNYSKHLTIHSSKMLNKFKRKKYAKTKNLITGETSASIEDQQKAKVMSSEIISHWHPNLTIGLVTDWTMWTLGAVPVPLNEYIRFIPDQKYQPVLFYNDYWNLLKDYTPINSTVKSLSLTLTYQPLSLFKWQLYAAQSMRNQWGAASNFLSGGQEEEGDEDQDALKEAMIETNPYLLGMTFVVSILHSVFEFLAFKNDIQFWNNRKSLEGLSVRSVFFNVFQSLIVLLYVLDNETNFVIRVSVFIGLIIEIWKINKVMDVKVDKTARMFWFLPLIKISDKGSYVESSTRVYDKMAFRYLSWLCFPLLGAYSVYSLIYQEHKGFYSWVLSMLYGFLLTFGFIMMTPQLFINYKLKSVAHLPWRMLTYKFLNTFIDDIFAFVIKMPTMYRIGCLRDDVIFFIYLYQRYIYAVDLKRVNEFGYVAESDQNQDQNLQIEEKSEKCVESKKKK